MAKAKTAADEVLAMVRKEHGDESMLTLHERAKVHVPTLPSGSLGLDVALGIGGYPHGRIIEIYGPEASGKTTLALHAVANAQKRGELTAYIDAEHAIDTHYAAKLGVNFDNLLFSQPSSGEEGLGIVDTLVNTGKVRVIVVDSVAALTPQAELDGDVGDAHVGLQARMMGQALRKFAGIVNRTGTILIFINQVRMKIGVMYGNPETQPGGMALRFYASVRLDVRRLKQVKEGGTDAGDPVGNETKVKVIKNKLSPPFKEAQFQIIWGEGIDVTGDMLNVAVASGIVQRSGAWFSYGDLKLGQGWNAAVQTLKDDPGLFSGIETETRKAAFK